MMTSMEMIKNSCLIEFTVECSWKILFSTSRDSATRLFVDEVGAFIFFEVKILQAVIHQKLLKSVDFFSRRYSKNKRRRVLRHGI